MTALGCAGWLLALAALAVAMGAQRRRVLRLTR